MDPSRPLRGRFTVQGIGSRPARTLQGGLVARRRPRWHQVAPHWRQLTALILSLSAVAGAIVLGRRTLAASLTALTSLNWTWFLLALCCEAVSLTAFGLSRRRLLRADGHPTGLALVMAVTYASNALSMTIPFAGAELAVVFSFREFRRRGLGLAITGWALAVSAIMSTSSLALVMIAGALAGGASVAAAAGLAGAVFFLLPAAAALLGLRYRHARAVLSRLLDRVVALSQRLFGWPGDEAASSLDGVLDRVAGIRMRQGRYGEAFGLAIVNWLGDCAGTTS